MQAGTATFGSVERKGRDSTWSKAVLIAFAIIGVLVVLIILGMLFFHEGMMGMFGDMMAACRRMMGGG